MTPLIMTYLTIAEMLAFASFALLVPAIITAGHVLSRWISAMSAGRVRGRVVLDAAYRSYRMATLPKILQTQPNPARLERVFRRGGWMATIDLEVAHFVSRGQGVRRLRYAGWDPNKL
jgi:hypothetical protein